MADETEPAGENVTTETEVTTSAFVDQPAVSADASASPSPAAAPSAEPGVGDSVPAEPPSSPAVSEPAEPVETIEQKAGGGFDSPFNPPPAGLSMIERLERLEKTVYS